MIPVGLPRARRRLYRVCKKLDTGHQLCLRGTTAEVTFRDEEKKYVPNQQGVRHYMHCLLLNRCIYGREFVVR